MKRLILLIILMMLAFWVFKLDQRVAMVALRAAKTP